MKSKLKKYFDTQGIENPYWMHAEDVVYNQVMITHIDAILNYYGGELHGECKTGKSD